MDGLLTAPGPEPDQSDPPGPAAVRLRWLTLGGLGASSAVVLGAVVGGTAFVSHLPGAWFFGTPGSDLGSLATGGKWPPVAAVVAVYGGLLLLTLAWLRLLRVTSARPGIGVWRVVGVIAVWAVPLLVAPPLFSRDVYTYAGQGEMVSHQLDPYTYGPGVLGATGFDRLAGPLWANTPSPYGPVFLSLDGVATELAGHQVLPDLVLLRLIEVAGLALVAAGLPTLARAAGRDPAGAAVLGVGSPLALATLLGGAHNDALMVGLLVAGLAVARRVGPVPGIVLCALATGVKAPAALGLVFIGWNWPGVEASVRARVGRTLEALAIGAATLSVVSWISGVGWGWVGTVEAPAKVFTGVTPVDAVSKVAAGAAQLVGLDLGVGTARAVFGVLGLVLAAGIGLWLLWRSPRLGTVTALGLTLLALALLSPILWAWYLSWGLVVLAPVAAGALRRAVIALSVVGAFVGVASVREMVRTYFHWGAVDDLALLAGAAVVILLLLLARRRPPYAVAGSPARSWPWSLQRATQPPGVTVTAIHRPQAGQ